MEEEITITKKEYDQLKAFIKEVVIPQTLAAQKEKMLGVSDCLEEAINLMEDVREGKYKPDSFTTQPWRKALSDIKKKVEDL